MNNTYFYYQYISFIYIFTINIANIICNNSNIIKVISNFTKKNY